jgi:hypothetical protein
MLSQSQVFGATHGAHARSDAPSCVRQSRLSYVAANVVRYLEKLTAQLAQHGVESFRLPRPTLVLTRSAPNAAEMCVLQVHTRSHEV